MTHTAGEVRSPARQRVAPGGVCGTVLPAFLVTLALSFATGCRDVGDEVPPAGRAGGGGAAGHTSPSPPRPASLDPRSQYDLAGDLDRIEGERDPNQRASGHDRVRSSWIGKRYRWRVRVLEPLCRAADSCNVLPFDRAGKDRTIVHGWMPRLELDDAGFAAIRDTCGQRPDCAIEMEGTLARFVLDTEQPTALEFRDVRIR